MAIQVILKNTDGETIVEGNFCNVCDLISFARAEGIPLIRADFQGASLCKVNFSGMYFGGADFSSTDCRGADFSNARLDRARFDGAKLCYANFSYSSGDDISKTSFQGADLTNASFKGANFPLVSFRSAVLSGTNFRHSVLRDPNFTDACLSQADFLGCQMRSFSGASSWDFRNLMVLYPVFRERCGEYRRLKQLVYQLIAVRWLHNDVRISLTNTHRSDFWGTVQEFRKQVELPVGAIAEMIESWAHYWNPRRTKRSSMTTKEAETHD